MIHHECEDGLVDCINHPRWNVTRSRRKDTPIRYPWWAWGPSNASLVDEPFTTFAEAIAYATERARAEKLAAIQDGAA